MERFEKHIPVATEGILAINLLVQHTDLSRQQIKSVMQKGAVWLTKGKHTQRLRRAKKPLTLAHTLHIYFDPQVLAQQPPQATLIADMTRYSVWNKPSGMLSQGSKWSDHCTITRWAEQQLQPQRNAFLVHRLDRAASGLIMVAHQKQAAAALAALFENRHIDKRYRIWVEGCFDQQPVTVNQPLDDRHAVSHFERERYDAKRDQSLVNVRIETGRKHQIRRHAASLGFPVVGDRLYGSQNRDVDLQLTACYLAFVCPFTGEQKRFELGED
jgi:tRNA pseudouridine32 synthase/23S rRNA pseudouridine746 synthase